MGQLSRNIDITQGVLQGEILSTLLFALYINDLESFFRKEGASGINIDNLNELLL